MALSDLGAAPRVADTLPFALEIDGAPRLLVHRFRAREALSQLFEVDVDVVSEDGALDLSSLIGQPAHLRVHHSHGVRCWHGIVSRAALRERHSHLTRYEVRIVPSMWLLGLRRDNRVFQDKTTPKILEEVFAAVDIAGAALDMRLVGDYTARNYCVQYRESDLAFAMRLMEEDGITFFFEHDDEAHKLVLSDDPAGHQPPPEGEPVRYRASPLVGGGAQVVSEASLVRTLPSGRATLRDYAFKTPSTDLLSQTDAEDDGGGVRTDLEVYEYPGEYVESGLGGSRAKLRAEELVVARQELHGRSDVRPLCAGRSLELLDHPSERISGRFLLTSVEHEGGASIAREPRLRHTGPEYRNGFTAIPADIPFRPPRVTPRPVIAGIQTALVTGPAGEEIYTDEFGRVKLQFFWDRLGKKDEASSCWVRVSQGWGGAGWGMMVIPRIGQEVIVQFIEGDPDRPLITGRVYNAEQTVPYSLPADKTRSTWKSNSTPGGGGSNEIRFEDKAGAEEIYLHGQKDWTIAIENDKNQTIGNNETASVGVDRSRSVGSNESVQIGSNETRSVGVDRSTSIGSNETLSVGTNQAITVGANHTMDVGAAQTETVGASKTQTVGADRTETIGANVTESIGANQTTSIGANLTESVGANVTRSVGGNVTETVAALQSTSIGAAYMENVGAAKMLNVGAAYLIDVGAAMMTNVGAVQSVNVGASQSINVGGSQSINVGASQSVSAAAKISLSAGSKVTIDCGSATVTIESGGKVTVKGSDLTLKGTGKINLDASGDVIVKSGGKVSVKGGGAITVKGSKIGLN